MITISGHHSTGKNDITISQKGLCENYVATIFNDQLGGNKIQ